MKLPSSDKLMIAYPRWGTHGEVQRAESTWCDHVTMPAIGAEISRDATIFICKNEYLLLNGSLALRPCE